MSDLHARLATAEAAERDCRADIDAMQERGEEVSPSYYSSAGLISQQVISLRHAISLTTPA